jgi:predicted GNAT family acetyltransferase
MPCYEVNTASVDLNAADHQLLGKALEAEGYATTCQEKEKRLSFSKGKVSGYHQDNRLYAEAPAGTVIDTAAIKRGFSRQVVEHKQEQFEAKGWKTTREGGKYVFTKPQQQASVGFQR